MADSRGPSKMTLELQSALGLHGIFLAARSHLYRYGLDFERQKQCNERIRILITKRLFTSMIIVIRVSPTARGPVQLPGSATRQLEFCRKSVLVGLTAKI